MEPSDFRGLWESAMTWAEFLAAAAPAHLPLWEGVYRTARLPAWALASRPPAATSRLLVIAEDWCGDASNTVPVIARWLDTVPGPSLRIIRRDEHPAVMDRYLTNGARSIPIVIALDADFHEVGHWGPRPRELQAWVMANRDATPRTERYKEVRRWYAADRGESTLREVVEAMGDQPAAPPRTTTPTTS